MPPSNAPALAALQQVGACPGEHNVDMPARALSFLLPASPGPWARGCSCSARPYLMRRSLSFSEGWSSSHWEKRAWDHSALCRVETRSEERG